MPLVVGQGVVRGRQGGQDEGEAEACQLVYGVFGEETEACDVSLSLFIFSFVNWFYL